MKDIPINQGFTRSISNMNSNIRRRSSSPPFNISDKFTPGTKSPHKEIDIKKAAALLAQTKVRTDIPQPRWTFDTGTGNDIITPPVTMQNGSVIFCDTENIYVVDADSGMEISRNKTGGSDEITLTPGPNDSVIMDRHDGTIGAIDNKGNQLWETKLDEEDSSNIIGLDGNIYVGSQEKNLQAIDGKTGEVKWRYPAKEEFSAIGTSKDNTAFFIGNDGKVLALDTKDGKKKWELQVKSVLKKHCKLDDEGNLYVSTYTGMVSLDGKTGKERWNFNAHDYMRAEPIFDKDGNIYLPTRSKFFNAIDGKTGEVKWTRNLVGRIDTPASLSPDGTLFVGTREGKFYGIDSKTGDIKWDNKTFSGPAFAPILTDDGVLYAGLSVGINTTFCKNVTAFNPETGEKLKEYLMPHKTYLSGRNYKNQKVTYDYTGPVVINSSPKDPEVLYMGTADGKLVALSRHPISTKRLEKEPTPDNKNYEIKKQKRTINIGGVELPINRP